MITFVFNIFLVNHFLINIIKSEKWFGIIKDYNVENHTHGYAGSTEQPMIDFYLCSKKKYRVHYKDDDPLTWSKNFSNCDPVGIGREIDGICIYSERKSYKGKLCKGNSWMRVIKDCNFSEQKEGFVGKLGTPLSCLAINGGDIYRISSLASTDKIISSNPKNASDRIVQSLFGKNIINEANYDNEYI